MNKNKHSSDLTPIKSDWIPISFCAKKKVEATGVQNGFAVAWSTVNVWAKNLYTV